MHLYNTIVIAQTFQILIGETFSFLSFSWKYLCLVSLAVVIRPTALIVWLPLLFYHFCGEQNKLKLITQRCIPIAYVLHLFSLVVWIPAIIFVSL